MNALSNYYEHGPLVLLQRPVVLIGFLGVDQHGLGRDLAALSGLPLVEVDRWIEHEAGQSLVSLVQTQGIEALRQLEDRFLAQALTSRPPGIVVLGDGALIKEANLQQVLDKATLVYLKLSLAQHLLEAAPPSRRAASAVVATARKHGGTPAAVGRAPRRL